jgi:hypothetical protein
MSDAPDLSDEHKAQLLRERAAKPAPSGLTTYDLVRRILRKPDLSDDDCGFILWNATCFPFGGVLRVARNLRDLRESTAKGLSRCCMCGREYRQAGPKPELGGECGPDGCLTWICEVEPNLSLCDDPERLERDVLANAAMA